jgi:hypothetical protein
MRHSRFKMAAIIGGAAFAILPAAKLLADANGVVVLPRVGNDFATSAETTRIDGGTPLITTVPQPAGDVGVPGLPASVEITDTAMPAGGGANRDDVLISTDGGATPWVGNLNSGFTVSATFTLNDGTNSPRKETGIRIDATPALGNGVTGDALFIIDSDAGEVVAFGGGAPFFLFGNNANGKGYTPGQTITLSETYTPGPGGTTGANPGSLTYSAQFAGGPLMTSGPLAFSNLEGGPGPNSFNVGIYDQTQSSGPIDFIDDNITNITASVTPGIVPEPTCMGLLGVGAVTVLTRRRARKA